MNVFEGSGLILPIIGLVLVAVIVVAIVVSRYKIARPDEAIIVTGSGGGKRSADDKLPGVQKVVQGGGVFVMPFVQQAHSISLSSRRLGMTIEAISSNNIWLRLEAVALVKVGGSDADVRAAAQRFLGQQEQIETFTQEVLSGALRSIVGTMSVDEIIRDRAAFATRVAEESESSLSSQGLQLDTFQIQDIRDNSDYLRNLGRPEEAEAKRRAAIAEAEAQREADQARIQAEEFVLTSQRELELRRAAIQRETDAAKAAAEAAGPLAAAQQRQLVLVEEQKAAEQAALLRERQLIAEVKKPADAELYRVQREAEAEKAARVAHAEAEAEAVRLAGEADLARRRAAAEAVEAEGAAEAAAISAKGQAEAEAMDKKAAAYKNYGESAIADILISVLPDMVREASAPMSNIKDLTVLATDGASNIAKTGMSNIATVMEAGKSLLGIDLGNLVGRFTNKEERNSDDTPSDLRSGV